MIAPDRRYTKLRLGGAILKRAWAARYQGARRGAVKLPAGAKNYCEKVSRYPIDREQDP